jgi:hypothetical protein
MGALSMIGVQTHPSSSAMLVSVSVLRRRSLSLAHGTPASHPALRTSVYAPLPPPPTTRFWDRLQRPVRAGQELPRSVNLRRHVFRASLASRGGRSRRPDPAFSRWPIRALVFGPLCPACACLSVLCRTPVSDHDSTDTRLQGDMILHHFLACLGHVLTCDADETCSTLRHAEPCQCLGLQPQKSHATQRMLWLVNRLAQ